MKFKERIESKLDQIIDVQMDQARNLAKNTSDIAHHIKRTDIIEAKLASPWHKLLLALSVMSAALAVAERLSHLI